MPRPPEVRTAMGFRDDYQLPDGHQDAMMMLGNTERAMNFREWPF